MAQHSQVQRVIKRILREISVNLPPMENPFHEQSLAFQSEAKPPIAETHFVKAVITLHGFDIAELGKGFCCWEFFKNEDLDVFTIRGGQKRELFEEAFLEANVHSDFSSES